MTTKVVAGNPVNERKKAKKWTPHGIQKVRKFKTIAVIIVCPILAHTVCFWRELLRRKYFPSIK